MTAQVLTQMLQAIANDLAIELQQLLPVADLTALPILVGADGKEHRDIVGFARRRLDDAAHLDRAARVLVLSAMFLQTNAQLHTTLQAQSQALDPIVNRLKLLS